MGSNNNNMQKEYKRVVARFGFINDKGDLEGEAVRILELPFNGIGVSPRGFMSSFDNEFADEKYKADITTPGTSAY